MDKIHSFFGNRLFFQKFPEDLQNAALTEPLISCWKKPRVFAQYLKMIKKTMFYKIDVVIKGSYGLVECVFTTLPNFFLLTDGNSSLVFQNGKKLTFRTTLLFNKKFPCTRWNKKWQSSKKIVDRKPRNFCILSEKDRKLMVFLKDFFVHKFHLWTRSIRF